MTPTPLRCDRCRTALPATVFNTSAPVACPGCHAPLLVQVFPAFLRAPTVGQAAETVGSDEDASCFFHPRKKAVVSCVRCGRFLCALCDLEIDGRHLCPTCVTARPGAANGGGGSVTVPGEFANARLLHDRMALSLAVLPLVFLWPVTLFTAPVALFLALRYWNEPAHGLVPRPRSAVFMAALLAFLEIAAWSLLAYYYFVRREHLPF